MEAAFKKKVCGCLGCCDEDPQCYFGQTFNQKETEDEKDNNKLAVDLDIGHIIVTYAVRSNDDGAPSGIRSAVVTILKD